jgi:hypothetical protein
MANRGSDWRCSYRVKLATVQGVGDEVPLYERVLSLVQPARPVVPDVPVPVVDLTDYAVLLTQVAS